MSTEAWALERVRRMQENAEANAGRLGVKLLRGHGYPNEVMCDAQDALALRAVLDKLAAADRLITAYRRKRAFDGLNGRLWDAHEHWLAEQEVVRLAREFDPPSSGPTT